MRREYMVLFLLLGSFFVTSRADGAESFRLNWEGTRQWAGPEVWASPLYDWRVENDRLVATPGPDRLLQQTVYSVGQDKADFLVTLGVQFEMNRQPQNPAAFKAGLAMGIKGLMNDPRHVLVGPKRRLEMGVRADGKVFIGATTSSQKLDVTKQISFKIVVKDSVVSLFAMDGNLNAELKRKLNPGEVVGNLGLAAFGPNLKPEADPAVLIKFNHWQASGDGLVRNKANAFGPILWSQYTRQGNKVKLLAMLAPMGENDPKNVLLQIKQGDKYKTIDRQQYDPLTYSAQFSVEIPDGPVEYRVVYIYLGKHHDWRGTFIPDPATTGEPLKVGVFSCDHGYAFPLPTMVANVKKHKPNLVFFAGDQIYENYGGFKLKRKPTELAMLDYLRKYYQFGWTWRDVLANCPSVIIPDDHDVFQGNLWGAEGRWTDDMNKGGYTMPPDWINGVQRTQTASLPDPYDPTPVKRDISVYYTDFKWGGVPIAVLEDRKWKSGPKTILPKKNPAAMTPEEIDPEGAQLLGERQEAFLKDWSKRTSDQPLRLILSQTIFCKGTTHAGAELKKNHFVTDTNGWPRSGRQRALAPFKDGKTIMLHGDQHMGLFVRHGIDQHEDGPYAFMVPGTSNGYPRAWWPNGETGEVAGDFTDPFGNHFTVFAAANPEPGTNKLRSYVEGNPEETAHRKGSGYGLVVVDPKTHAVTFNMYRYFFDADKPSKDDQFPGFPVTIQPE